MAATGWRMARSRAAKRGRTRVTAPRPMERRRAGTPTPRRETAPGPVRSGANTLYHNRTVAGSVTRMWRRPPAPCPAPRPRRRRACTPHPGSPPPGWPRLKPRTGRRRSSVPSGHLMRHPVTGPAAGGGKPFTPAPCKPPPSGGGGYVLHSRRPVPPWQAGRMVRRRTTIPGRSTRCLTKDLLNRNI